ncbi:Glycoside Hydrolase Family 23 protein [Trametes cinnabarina]|uniref:Glycoside Hydrolase Family 23 protein n=1 Tax=Pycnoporus cinnabarinus TaxID=5643 RepID=A0A060SS33_PYCCI|nr:Glycoside Hydrolase Family 23 protein [Trametes cinnabarina]
MKLSAPFLVLLAALGVAEASSHVNNARMARHHGLAARSAHDSPVIRRGSNGRCKVHPTTSTLVSSSTHHTTSTHPSTHAAETTHTAPAALNNKDNNKSSGSSSSNSGSSGGKSVITNNGLIKITSSSCGSPGASKDITATAGPNGKIDWMNCGIENGGWNPPFVKVSDIVTVDLQDAIKDPNTPFKACSDYIDLFVKYANQHGVPPILIASIAMQESSCNRNEVGGAGEQGLMQITQDKCHGAPGGDCKDPDFNIRTGTAFFADTLNSNGGSLLLTLGNYNGWRKGMTYEDATAAAHGKCCLCQNNLDYLQQTLNGWAMNIDPTGSLQLGKFFNLNICHNRGG